MNTKQRALFGLISVCAILLIVSGIDGSSDPARAVVECAAGVLVGGAVALVGFLSLAKRHPRAETGGGDETGLTPRRVAPTWAKYGGVATGFALTVPFVGRSFVVGVFAGAWFGILLAAVIVLRRRRIASPS